LRLGTALFGAAAAAFLIAASCRTTTVVIPVNKPPDIDPSLYRRVAVLPFDGDGDEGLLAAKTVREELEAEDNFLVEPAETVEAALDRLDVFDPADRDAAVGVGEDLGVDAVLIGKAEFIPRTYSPEGDIRNELYTADRQTMPPFEFGTPYATRHLDVHVKFTLRLTVKALDVRTGRLMRRREFEATSTRTYKQREVNVASGQEKEIFEELLEGVVEDFVYTLRSHEVAQARGVVTF
jgi:hypothetical protein